MDNNEFRVVKLAGEINVATAALVGEKIRNETAGADKVILDFSDVSVVSSAGIRELMVCRKNFPGDRMKIINVNTEIVELFETVGVTSIIPIESSNKQINETLHLSFKKLLKNNFIENPDKVFIQKGDLAYTWSDIEKASHIMAFELSKLGVKKGSHVGICSVNSINWVIAFFAIQKLNAISLLVNNSASPKELATISKVGDLEYLCYGKLENEETYIENLKSEQDNTISKFFSISEDIDYKERFAEYDAISNLFNERISSDYPSVMLFTSGSTGVPKGVILSAYNCFNSANEFTVKQKITSEDVCCLILPLFHVFGFYSSLLAPAINKAKIVIPVDNHTGTIINTVYENKCTILNSVPTMLVALLANKNFKEEYFLSLRATAIAGAAATPDQVADFFKKMKNNHIINTYGMTEMCPATATDYDGDVKQVSTTIGKIKGDIELIIQDVNTKQTCDKNVVGEILMRGYTNMLGYYKLPVESQAIDENGWIKSGDLGFIDDDNNVHISGRIKELIIRGGENIMPLEVAAAVGKIKGVKDVKVVGVPSDFRGEEVAACITLEDDCSFDEKTTKEQLKEYIADYKIPKYFFIYNELPKLGNGKVDSVRIKKEAEEKAKALENKE